MTTMRASVLIDVAGKIRPSREQLSDVAFGWPLLLELVALNASAALTVREGDVIAVRGVEDLAAMIERTGRLCGRRGWSLLVANSESSLQIETLVCMREAHGGCVALDGRVRLGPEVLEAAKRHRIAIVHMSGSGHAAP